MSLFEILMLVCFGASWPVSIAKALRTKQVAGKSPLFMVLLLFGYFCGILNKLFYNMDGVIWLYGLNFCLVSVDLWLYYCYTKCSANTK